MVVADERCADGGGARRLDAEGRGRERVGRDVGLGRYDQWHDCPAEHPRVRSSLVGFCMSRVVADVGWV